MKWIETCRVLAIDDEPAVLRILALMLKKIGFKEVDTAENGGQGISKIDRNAYDLIFTDIKMAGLTGVQVLDHIRNINNSIPVIGISGTPWLLTDQFDAVLSKPFTKSELIEILDTIDKKPPSPDPKKKSCKQESHGIKPGSPPQNCNRFSKFSSNFMKQLINGLAPAAL